MRRWTVRRLSLIVGAVLIGLLIGITFFIAPAEDRYLRQAADAIAQRDFESALGDLDDYLSRHPGDFSARLLAAEAARRAMDYDEAKKHLRLYEQDGGPSAPLELEQSLLSAQRGHAGQSALVFAFCQAHPTAAEVPLALEALIVGDLNSLSRPLESPRPLPLDNPPPELRRLLTSVDMWLERCPSIADQAQGLTWRGRTRSLAWDHQGAVSDFKRALEVDPDHFEARAYLALTIAQENPHQAISEFELLCKRRPDEIRLRFALATALRGVGDLDQARDLLNEILRGHPNNVQVLLERAQLALDQRELETAKEYLDRAAGVAPETARLHLVFARYMTMIGNSEAARDHQARFQELEAQESDNTSEL